MNQWGRRETLPLYKMPMSESKRNYINNESPLAQHHRCTWFRQESIEDAKTNR